MQCSDGGHSSAVLSGHWPHMNEPIVGKKKQIEDDAN